MGLGGRKDVGEEKVEVEVDACSSRVCIKHSRCPSNSFVLSPAFLIVVCAFSLSLNRSLKVINSLFFLFVLTSIDDVICDISPKSLLLQFVCAYGQRVFLFFNIRYLAEM